MRKVQKVIHHHIFQLNPDKLQEMLELRRQGKSLPYLAAKYSVEFNQKIHHTSILNMCQKYGVKPGTKVEYRQIKPLPRCLRCGKECRVHQNKYCSPDCGYEAKKNVKVSVVNTIIEGEKVNWGTDYAGYLAEEKRKKIKNKKVEHLLGC